MLYSLPGAQAADSYLEALQAEAVNEAPVEQPPAAATEAPSGGWAAGDQSFSANIPSGLSRSDFEKALKQLFYGSYLFYNKLNDTQQQQAYEAYTSDSRIEHVRAQIMRLYRSR